MNDEWRRTRFAIRKEAEEMIILIFSRRGEEKMGNERCYIVIEILRFRSRDREDILALNRPCYRGEWKPGSRKKPDRSCSVNFSTAPRFLRHARAFYGSLLKLITFRQTCFLSLPLPIVSLPSFSLSLFSFFNLLLRSAVLRIDSSLFPRLISLWIFSLLLLNSLSSNYARQLVYPGKNCGEFFRPLWEERNFAKSFEATFVSRVARFHSTNNLVSLTHFTPSFVLPPS